jgi:23S rRNA pseudouridine1911/1915/1917 synthase
VEKQKGKLAKLDYRLIAASKTYYLLEVQLHTGRHHQIRAQFAAIGLHIKGDLKYGFPRSNPDGGICLHARSISFVHPVRKEELTIVADPPQDTLWDAFLSQL